MTNWSSPPVPGPPSRRCRRRDRPPVHPPHGRGHPEDPGIHRTAPSPVRGAGRRRLHRRGADGKPAGAGHRRHRGPAAPPAAESPGRGHAAFLHAKLRQKGVRLHLGCTVEGFAANGDRVNVLLKNEAPLHRRHGGAWPSASRRTPASPRRPGWSWGSRAASW